MDVPLRFLSSVLAAFHFFSISLVWALAAATASRSRSVWLWSWSFWRESELSSVTRSLTWFRSSWSMFPVAGVEELFASRVRDSASSALTRSDSRA